jgi:Thermolysin metallopeptidase, alpha-helical domain
LPVSLLQQKKYLTTNSKHRIFVTSLTLNQILNTDEWTSSLIPSTNNDTEWTDEADPKAYQAFWVVSQLMPVFEGIDFNFEKVSVANCNIENAFAVKGSTIQNAYIGLGNISGYSFATFDAVGHELGHIYLSQFLENTNPTGNGALHEGLSDIIGTYVESLIPSNNGVDWIISDDEPFIANLWGRKRDLSDPDNTSVIGATNWMGSHANSQPLGYWYFLISQGQQLNQIPALGMKKAFDIIIESLTLVETNAGYNELMQATIMTVLDKFGRCSNEFVAVARAWELIGVPTGYLVNGIVPACNYSIVGPSSICEENDKAKFCISGGLPNNQYHFRIIGKKSTEYKSECGMQGNSQVGCNCLSLTDFPKYPYYPQTITIEAYSPTAGVGYIQRKQLTLVDCDDDDPTCEEYYDLRGEPTEERLSHRLNQNISNNSDKNSEFIKVFNMLGNLLFEGKTSDIIPDNYSNQSLIIVVYYDTFGNIINVKKSLGFR